MKRLLLLTFCLAPVAFATTLLAVDVPALSRNADAIVLGTVLSSKPRLAEGGRIITDTELQIAEVFKGKAMGRIVVMQPGGIVGDLGQRVEGTAPFHAGEEVVVFLDARGERFIVTGMVQGKFKIERSKDGKEVLAVPEAASSARLIDPITHQETSSGLQPIALSALKVQIASSLAGPQPVVAPVRPATTKGGP
jgi:hypothetical protein